MFQSDAWTTVLKTPGCVWVRTWDFMRKWQQSPGLGGGWKSFRRWWVHCWKLLILCFRRELCLQGRTAVALIRERGVTNYCLPLHLCMCDKVAKEYFRNYLWHYFISLASLGGEFYKWNVFLTFCSYLILLIICSMAVAFAGGNLSSWIWMSF